MKWLEEMLADVEGSDGKPLPGATPDQIAELASYALGGETMVNFIHGFFLFQKNFSNFIGVGESTVAGWVKNGAFPAYAKRAALAAYFARKHWQDLKETRRDAERPKIIKDGDSYLIVQFRKDAVGVEIGKILARDIPTEKAALIFASGVRAWELLRETEYVIEQEIENRDEEDSHWLVALKEAIQKESFRVLIHEKYLESEGKRREAMQKLDAELAAKNEGKTTEEILVELLGNDAPAASTAPTDDEEEK